VKEREKTIVLCIGNAGMNRINMVVTMSVSRVNKGAVREWEMCRPYKGGRLMKVRKGTDNNGVTVADMLK
jgi:hypothetical protein